jgi:hypothetical protein
MFKARVYLGVPIFGETKTLQRGTRLLEGSSASAMVSSHAKPFSITDTAPAQQQPTQLACAQSPDHSRKLR